MDLLTAEEFAVESKRYYHGDRKARPPQHLYRLIRPEDLAQVLGPDNWAVVRYSAALPLPLEEELAMAAE